MVWVRTKAKRQNRPQRLRSGLVTWLQVDAKVIARIRRQREGEREREREREGAGERKREGESAI